MHVLNNKIETDLYSKPTDAHQYLHWTSCHPPHTRKNLPFSLAYRLRRICSTDHFLTKRLEELRQFLQFRKYKNKIIDLAIQKALAISRQSTFTRKNKVKSNDRVPLVTTYHPGLPNLHNIVKLYFPLLQRSARCKDAIPKIPIVAYRRPKNLKDILVRARLRNNDQSNSQFKFSSCQSTRCGTCMYTKSTSTFTIVWK